MNIKHAYTYDIGLFFMIRIVNCFLHNLKIFYDIILENT